MSASICDACQRYVSNPATHACAPATLPRRERKPRVARGSDGLTPRQREIFEFIKGYVERRRLAPSVREIGQHVGLASSQTVWRHLRALQRLGLIRRDAGIPRSIEVIGDAPV